MNQELARVIGDAARAARARLELTQAQVAEEVGIAPMVYSRLERGLMLPSVPTLVRLCEVLHIPPDELLGFATGPSRGGRRSTRAQHERDEALRHLLSLAGKLGDEQIHSLITMAQALMH